MLDLGKVKPGSTIRIPFSTFDSNDPSASTALSNFAVADINVYKDGSTTQRASTSGYTATTSFDTLVGVNMAVIDLSDNTTAGFYEAGSEYLVVIGDVTVDSATLRFIAARFTIGYEGALLDTTIASLASQTSFTLEDGSADNDAYNGCIAVVHDLASDVQIAMGYVTDYVGSTKTVTLAADPGIFTMAAGDNVSLLLPSNVTAVAGTSQTAGDLMASLGEENAAAAAGDPSTTESVMQYVKQIVNILAGSAGIATFPAEAAPANAVSLAEVIRAIHADVTGLNGDAMRGTDGANTTTPPTAAAIRTEIDANSTQLAAIVADTDELQSDWANGGRLDLILDARAAQTTVDAIETDTQDIQGRLPVALVGGRMDSNASAISGDSGAADNLEQSAKGIVTGTATGTPSTTVIDTDLTEATDDHYNGRILTFVSGAVAGQATDITDYNGTTKELTVTALTTAPSSGDAFVIT